MEVLKVMEIILKETDRYQDTDIQEVIYMLFDKLSQKQQEQVAYLFQDEVDNG